MTVTLTSVLPVFDAAPLPQVGKNARNALAAVADGNGLSAAQIRIAREDNTIARLQGEISVAFSNRLQLDHKPGRHTTGTTATSEDEARTLAAERAAALAQNTQLHEMVEQEIHRLPAQGWGCDTLRFNLGAGADDVFCVVEPCSSCKGAPLPSCAICAGSGESSKILTARYSAEISFTLWRQGADVVALDAAEKLGVRNIGSDDLGDVFIMPLAAEGTRLRAQCVAFIPVAKIEFSLEGRFVTAVVAGKKGKIVALDPILDKFVKPGVAALLKLSRGPLAVDSLVSMAMKYRLVRQTLQALLIHPRKTVYQQLQRDYPIGVSDKYLRACVKYAAAAQEALMVEPRQQGLRLGIIASIVISLVYLFALRPMIADAMLAIAADVSVVALLSVLTVFIIKKRAAMRIMAITRAAQAPAQLPPMGREGMKAPLLVALAFFAAAVVIPAKPPYAQVVADTTTAALGPLLSSVLAD